MDANLLHYEPGKLPVDDGVARSPGAVIRLHDGRAGVVLGLNSIAAGSNYAVATEGVHELTCSSLTVTDLNATPEAWWDTDNSKVVTTQPTNGFKVGVLDATVASTDTKCKVKLNVEPRGVTIDFTVGASPSTSQEIKTGLLTIIGIPLVQITRLTSAKYRTIITSFDITVSGGTVTIANVGSNYTLTEGDTITVIARGLGTAT